MKSKIIDAPFKEAVGMEFDGGFPNKPNSDIVGEGWVIVEEDLGDRKTCYGYCTDPNCECEGSMTYY